MALYKYVYYYYYYYYYEVRRARDQRVLVLLSKVAGVVKPTYLRVGSRGAS